ncbi:MAG: M50 family metallopeptidase [Micromonosporaceae bacterium]|nr:M50 family metallopeptidase [Micromonosporaceae bacterium]
MTPDAGPPAQPRPSGIRLGRVLGVPVYLRWSWLLLAAVVVVLYAGVLDAMLPQLTLAGRYAFAVGFVLCLLLSVLLHEVGHAVVARHYGIRVRTIMLEVLGGYTEMEADSPHPRADLAVSAVGPIVSSVLGLVALGGYLSLPRDTVVSQLLFQLARANLVVAVFNALPGLPLDGGRAVRAVVWGLTGNRHTATTVAGWLGRILAAALAVTAVTLLVSRDVSVLIPLLLVLLASTIWQGATIAIIQGRLLARLPRVNLRQLARPIVTVPTGTPLAEVIRRVVESGLAAPAVAVADGAGRIVALVHEESAAAVPPERRPWIPIDSVARTLEPGRTLTAEMSGEDVINAVRAHPAREYLVVSGADVVGVLRLVDLDKVLRT